MPNTPAPDAVRLVPEMNAGAATPASDLRDHIMNPNIPKSEAEWWAGKQIAELEAKIALLAAAPAPATARGGDDDLRATFEHIKRLMRSEKPFHVKIGNALADRLEADGVTEADFDRVYGQADLASQPQATGGAVEREVTLDWQKVETTALEEWRSEFGDYDARVVLGHDNVWSYRVNNSGHLGFASADEAKQQALAAVTKRLTARLAAARETVALYAAIATNPLPAAPSIQKGDEG